MSEKRPEAMELADMLLLSGCLPGSMKECAGHELRRLHALNAELLEVLKSCDEAMDYMSEYDIPLTLPSRVKAAIAKATKAQE